MQADLYYNFRLSRFSLVVLHRSVDNLCKLCTNGERQQDCLPRGPAEGRKIRNL